MKPTAHPFRSCCPLGLALGVVSLLTACTGAPEWGRWSKAPTPAQIMAVMNRQETFIYFSRYEVYQNDRTKEYVYQQGQGWIHSILPPASVTKTVLLESPAVKITLRGSPAERHAEVRQAYPTDWIQGSAVAAIMP